MRARRQVRKTLLAVGEGDCEVAFLRHLRELYCSGMQGVNVTVRNAHGKGPKHVVDHVAGLVRRFDYDACVALLDTDIEWTEGVKKVARNAGVELVGSTPCFEGLLLSILGRRPPGRCEQCKRETARLLGFDLTLRQSYAAGFSRSVLDASRAGIPELDRLLSRFEGRRED